MRVRFQAYQADLGKSPARPPCSSAEPAMWTYVSITADMGEANTFLQTPITPPQTTRTKHPVSSIHTAPLPRQPCHRGQSRSSVILAGWSRAGGGSPGRSSGLGPIGVLRDEGDLGRLNRVKYGLPSAAFPVTRPGNPR